VCAPISVSVGIMQWNTEFRYFGVTVVANNKFKSSFSESRRTFLALLMQFMEELEIKTISPQHCHYYVYMPALLFRAEAAIDDKVETTKLRNAYNKAWAKKNSTYDSNY